MAGFTARCPLPHECTHSQTLLPQNSNLAGQAVPSLMARAAAPMAALVRDTGELSNSCVHAHTRTTAYLVVASASETSVGIVASSVLVAQCNSLTCQGLT